MRKDLNTILLTRQELQIMKVVWDRGAATVRQVCETLAQKKNTAYTTILTLMGILEEKGILVHSKSGRAYVYRPVLSRRQAMQNHVRDLIERLYDGNAVKLIEDVLENEFKAPELVPTVKNMLELKQMNKVA